jgi:hypothetical protein
MTAILAATLAKPDSHRANSAANAAAVTAEAVSTLINLAGRQRMLSQKIGLQAVLLSTGRADALAGAREALQMFKESHELLVKGGNGLPGLFSPALEAEFFGAPQADVKARRFIALADDAIVALAERRPHAAAALDALIAEAQVILPTLNRVTLAYESEAKARVDTAKRQLRELMHSIRDVAREARIVSFNAQVIAARAGDKGREFSVVADVLTRVTGEIDALAQTAMRASQQ